MTRPTRPTARPPRRDRRLRPNEHDTFATARKPAGPCVCPDCDAVFAGGRWTWGETPARARLSVCPACRRIRGRHPKGIVTLRGEWYATHRKEILALVTREERLAKEAHPLSRLMRVENGDDGSTVLSTTDIHLARRIGEALGRAGGGRLRYRFDRDREHVRVTWER